MTWQCTWCGREVDTGGNCYYINCPSKNGVLDTRGPGIAKSEVSIGVDKFEDNGMLTEEQKKINEIIDYLNSQIR